MSASVQRTLDVPQSTGRFDVTVSRQGVEPSTASAVFRP
jgi:hypothetical protein